MRNNRVLFISILLIMVVLSIGAISAQDVDAAVASDSNDVVLADSESVSGGVDVVTENPWNTTGSLSYDIPSDAITIKSADVYVNIYAGSASNTYGANANISINAGPKNAEYGESLWIEEGSTDGTVYIVNDHTTKCYSDYMIHYDITDMLDGLNGSELNIDVSTFKMDDKQFDGRIKLIALVLAYEDGDDDSISYWINDDQLWTKTNVTVTFDTEDITYINSASLVNVVLSSGDGNYIMNGEFLGDADIHVSGDYYQYNEWDVTDVVKANQNTELNVLFAGGSPYGSIKNALSVLTMDNTKDNTVSGDVDVVAVNPWDTTGELIYDIPSDAIAIKSADVYVNVYAGSASNTYGANAKISINAGSKSEQYGESLWIEEGSTDGTVYIVNDHTTKCYSDYMIHYDITGMLDGLNGTELSIDVSTFEMDDKKFDGRIKLIALVLAYDDGDDDFVSYWINDDQLWTKTNVTVTFDTEDILWLTTADLVNVVLSSGDGTYLMNGEPLGDAYVHESGNYFQYNEWIITSLIEPAQKTDLDVIYAGESPYGSIKNALSVLVIYNNIAPDNAVSGGVDFVAVNPWNTTGELIYDIPSDAIAIKSADVYVNVYAGSASNTYGANAKISINAGSKSEQYGESLWIEEGSTDGTVYEVNDHTTKCYSDYMIHYDITDMLDGLNGTELSIDVSTFEMDDKKFDGRIKLIALVLAYDDGDDDVIKYWINDDQLWTKNNLTITYFTEEVTIFSDAKLQNIVLSSADGTYVLNDEFLGDADVHVSGDYYQYNEWNVTDFIEPTRNTALDVSYAGTSAYGSIKNVLSLLTVTMDLPEISITPEYTNVPSAYAGTNNTLTIKVTTSKAGNYTVRLLADGVDVDSADVALDEGENIILLTDSTIRPLDETTVNGAENNVVMYTAELSYNDVYVNSEDVYLPVLYNGNLGSDYEFNITGFDDYVTAYYINGELVIDVKDASSYLGSAAMNRTDVWNVKLDKKSDFTDAFIYVPYNWFNAKSYTEDMSMFDTTFNGATVTPVAWYRDQSNLGNYGMYGYGVLVYDVSDLITVGDNSFVLNKIYPTPAVYPSALVYMYNTTGSKFTKTVNILNGADLLANSSNVAQRIVKADTEMNIGFKNIDKATLYVLAAGAQVGESDIVFNDAVYSNVWNGTSSTTDLFATDVTDLVENSNSISFVATGSTILALPQIIVTYDEKINTVLSADDVTIHYMEDAEIIATLTNERTGKPISGANVRVKLNGETYGAKTNSKGQVIASFSDLAIGNYTATVSYSGNSKYLPSSLKVNVEVTKLDTVLSVVYDDVAKELVATLANNVTGQMIKSGNVRFAVDGVKYTVKSDANGQAKLSTENWTYGIYDVDVSYYGNSKYNPSSTEFTLVTKLSTSLSAIYNTETKQFVAKLINTETGVGIKGANIVINLNGVKTSVKTDKNGEAVFALGDANPKDFSAGFSYGGNSKYLKSTTKINAAENKITTSLSTVYDKENSEVIATLTNSETGKVITGANVVINVNGVKTAVKTNKEGQAKLLIEDLDAGAWSVGGSYGGNSKYVGTTTSMTIVKF